MDLDFNITYRLKDRGIQAIISYKVDKKWKQKSKQGFPNTRDGKKKAKAWADSELQKIKETRLNNLNANYENITFADFKDIFIKQLELYKSIGSLKTYRSAFKAFDKLNDLQLKEINNLHIQSCIDDLTRRNLKKITIQGYLTKISTLFNSAINEYNILTKSPVRKIKLKDEKESTEKKALTMNEFNTLVNAFENSIYNKYVVVILLAGTCGLRIGEIMGLTWNDIDLTNNMLSVNKQWKVVKTKPYKEFGFGELKSKNSYRSVPIPSKTSKYLKKLKSTNQIYFLGRIIKNKSTDSITAFLNKKFKDLGFPITIHELRHTYATNLIANGLDFKTAAKLLGHDIEQTMKTYSHVNDDMMNRAITLVENIF